MGMFDSVYFKCRKCGVTTEAQSKSGNCVLASYSSEEVPVSVVSGLDDLIYCVNCGETLLDTKPEQRIRLY